MELNSLKSWNMCQRDGYPWTVAHRGCFLSGCHSGITLLVSANIRREMKRLPSLALNVPGTSSFPTQIMHCAISSRMCWRSLTMPTWPFKARGPWYTSLGASFWICTGNCSLNSWNLLPSQANWSQTLRSPPRTIKSQMQSFVWERKPGSTWFPKRWPTKRSRTFAPMRGRFTTPLQGTSCRSCLWGIPHLNRPRSLIPCAFPPKHSNLSSTLWRGFLQSNLTVLWIRWKSSLFCCRLRPYQMLSTRKIMLPSNGPLLAPSRMPQVIQNSSILFTLPSGSS